MSNRRIASLGLRILLALGSAAAGLVCAELIARGVRRGASPFLQIFVKDSRFGVALAPSRSVRLVSKRGRITHVQTNARGFRDNSGPASPERSVLLLGDSQMFGYGVEEAEATSSLLEAELGNTAVTNLAIPTYGPEEYVRSIEVYGPVHEPSTVVLVANLANDWREASTPNTKRTSATNGWAVRYTPNPQPAARWSAPAPGGRFELLTLASIALARLRGTPSLEGMHVERLLEQAGEMVRGPAAGRASRLTPFLVRAARACEALGCEVVLAILPIDVEAHPSEWKKHGLVARSTESLRILAGQLQSDAERLGVRSVDLLDALERASPGAFLDDDYHLSPKGHRAVARALARLIEGADEGEHS